MTLTLIILGLVVIVNCCFIGYLISDVTNRSKREDEPCNVLWAGIISFFQFIFSTFGISDFAIGAAAYSKLKWVPAKKLPGTVNAAAVIPIAIMAIVYITAIEIDLATLIVPIIAQLLGAYIMPRFVVKMPVKPIRIFLALGMIVAVLRIAVDNLGILPDSGTLTSLPPPKLAVLGVLCFLYGSLNNLGLGSFAPTMATICALGMSPQAAFPIMMGACAFSIPVAGIQFVKHGSYSRKITVVTAICGTIGVLAAAFLLTDVDLSAIKWVVAAFLLYSACSMLVTAFRNREDAVIEAKPQKAENNVSNVNTLTNICVALILVCTVSLILVFVGNIQVIVSENVETSISEHNARIRDNVQAYLKEQESFILSVRVGVAHFMAEDPVNLEQLRLYLEEAADVRDDISTLYCTTNELWNGPGGYAVFNRPWDTEDGNPPPEWDNTIRPWYIAAKNVREEVAYSKPFVDALTGDIILALSANVYDRDGRDIGVISEDVTIEALNAMLQSPVSIEGHEVFLIDADGIFVVHPDKMMAAQGNFFHETGLEEHRDSILSADQYFAARGGMAVYSMSIPSAKWFVVSVIPTANIYSSANKQILSIFLAPIAIIVFMLLATLISLLQERKDKIELKRLSDELKKASNAKSDFLAKMSHEMRTPMNAIIGMSELAMRKDKLSDAREDMTVIKNAGTNLLAIINDILDLSKIESGKMEIIADEYCVASLINDVTAIIKVRLAGSPVRFDVIVDDTIPGTLSGDVVRIRQALLNILNNAVKFTKEGAITFTLSGDMIDNDTVVLAMTVTDTGKGIKEQDIEKLFGDFVQVDTAGNRGIEGTGLGLAITKRLVNAMGGDIRVESEYGKGSAFTITLPQKIRSREPVTPMEFNKHDESTDVAITFRAPEARVLIVDDVTTNLKVAEGLMAPYNMRVDTCLSGDEAIRATTGTVYDIIFMDHMMPVMDGVEAVNRIRALGCENRLYKHLKDIPIIALTANAVTGVREMFLQNGFNDFLSKPIDTAKLNAMLKKWLPKRKQVSVGGVSANGSNMIGRNENGEVNIGVDGVDVNLGISRTGGTAAGFLGTLSVFCVDGRKKIADINRALEACDLPLYTTYIHALKSALANIGAVELSISAKELEDAGKRGDREFIDENNPKLLADLETLLRGVGNALASAREISVCADTNAKDLKPILTNLKAAINDINPAMINAAVKELEPFRNARGYGNAVEDILHNVLNGDYGEAVSRIESLIH